MGQAGVRVDSPVTLLREHVDAVRRLLHGEEVSVQGRCVQLDRVQLRFPPEEAPPVLVGGRGPRTLAVAGELADGVILDDVAPEGQARRWRVQEALEQVGAAWEGAARAGAPQVVGFLPAGAGEDAAYLAEQVGQLWEAGVHRVAVFAGGVDRPPAQGEAAVLRLVPALAAAAAQLDG